MPRIKYLLITAGLLVSASWAIHGYRSSVLDDAFLAYGQSRIVTDPNLKLDSTAATIRGKITNAKTGSAVKDVQIITSVPGGGYAQAANSDINGNYEIRVAPGPHSVAVRKDGFVGTEYRDVANLPVLPLSARQQATVDFRLVPGAVIEGIVTDESGAPIPDVNLSSPVKVYRQGKIELQSRAGAHTNARGEYRMINLPAGRYYVQAHKNGIAGPGIRTFAQVIYPDASRIEDAQAITVAAGEVRRAVNLRLPNAAKHSVSGRITFLATGQPVANMDIRMDPDSTGFGMRAETKSHADGTFRLD